MCFVSSVWFANMLRWNPIQQVSFCGHCEFDLICWHAAMKPHPSCELLCALCAWLIFWHAAMKSHPASEFLCVLWAWFDLLTCRYEIPSRLWVSVCFVCLIWFADILTCCHKIPSRLWVAVCFVSLIWFADMLPPIQIVSCCVLWELDLISCWHVAIKSHPASDFCALWAWFDLLTCCYEIPSREWVAVCFVSLIWFADMSPWNHIQIVSCCVLCELDLISDMLPWNPIQRVSCSAPTGLYLNHCSHFVNKPAFHRWKMFQILSVLNSMYGHFISLNSFHLLFPISIDTIFACSYRSGHWHPSFCNFGFSLLHVQLWSSVLNIPFGLLRRALILARASLMPVKYYKPSMFSRLIAFLSNQTLRLHAV